MVGSQSRKHDPLLVSRLAKIQIAVFDGVAMIERTATSDLRKESQQDSQALCHAPVTIFAIPKAFEGDAIQIQRNAINSWLQLSPSVDVLLFGDESGIGEFARESNAFHQSHIDRNSNGTPLVSSAFAAAHRLSSSPVLVYCNSDVILGLDFVEAIERLSSQTQIENWLAIASRTDLAVDRPIDVACEEQRNWLDQQCATNGQRATRACKEFFAFKRGLCKDIPPFAVGRGNWDNWIVANAKANRVPVIDLSEAVSVIHQSHDYAHMSASRMRCYVNGEEARENQQLAGGRNLIVGSTCTHRLGDNGIEKIGLVQSGIDFIRDVPRFAKLMAQLMLGQS